MYLFEVYEQAVFEYIVVEELYNERFMWTWYIVCTNRNRDRSLVEVNKDHETDPIVPSSEIILGSIGAWVPSWNRGAIVAVCGMWFNWNTESNTEAFH